VTAEGKAKSARNAYRSGFRPMLRGLTALLRDEVKTVRDLADSVRGQVKQDGAVLEAA
jgi:hypothetical protein